MSMRPPSSLPVPSVVMRLRQWAAAAGAVTLSVMPLLAGDILRGGAPAQGRGAPQAGGPPPVQTAKARAAVQDSLARTARAVQDVRAMQQSARAAAQAAGPLRHPTVPGVMLPVVPNGLKPGGLQLAGSPVGALNPVQSGAGGAAAAQVTVKQTAQQALLNWNSFNIGKETTLKFDQSAGGANRNQWIAFNKVNDPSGVPSQILGSLQADGQVYVINQNGIIFGGTSQVNVHTLTASALPINDTLIQRGLLNQSSTAQFLFSGLPQSGETPFTPPPPPPGGRYGAVTVLAGARLSAPTTEANVGGRIALIGATVTNEGTLSTPDGQTLLAAGLQVGLAAHSSTDASLRGLDAYVGQVGDYAGTVTNTGLIEIPRGSVALTGKDVRQLGVIESSTSVSLNGRIDLRAEYNASANQKFDPVFSATSPPFLYGGQGANQSTGAVTVGAGSVMSVLPEWGSEDKVIGTGLALRSQVNARGKTVHFEKGALLHAPNAAVALETGVWDLDGPQNRTAFVRSGGQIYLDRDVSINVAGTTDAAAPLSQHILTVTLRSSELADSPLQRSSFFRGGEITVDLRKSGVYNGRPWVGTPLADLRGYGNLIERTVDELTVAGGNVKLASGGSIVVQDGASIDTSAGWLNYGEGVVKTTRLLRFGRLLDIAAATPDVVYDGLFTGEFIESHPKWGVNRTYRVPWMTGEHFEQSYLSGADAGNLSLAAASMAVDGIFRAAAVNGPRQTTVAPRGGTLELGFEVQQLVAGGPVDPLVSPTPPRVVFSETMDLRSADAFGTTSAGDPLPLRDDRIATVVLEPGLLRDGGWAGVRVRNPDGDIHVPKDVMLETPVKGAITLEGATVRVDGRLVSPGGAVSLLAYNLSPSAAELLNKTTGAQLPPPNPGRGLVTLGAGALISTAGQIVDYRPAGLTPLDQPTAVDGGQVSIKSYAADLARGSLIDVSGGVTAGARGGFTYGRAGFLELQTGRDLSIQAVDGGRLQLGAGLKGFSGLAGGSGLLSIQAQMVQVGGARVHPLALQLTPEFFNEGGFGAISLTGIGWPGAEDGSFLPAVLVAAGTMIEPVVSGWLAVPYGGAEAALELRPYGRPEGLRSTASLTFQGLGARDTFGNRLVSRGDVVVGAGAKIRTDALGAIVLRGETVSVAGEVYAPGGAITVTGSNQFPSIPLGAPLPTVHLAAGTVLSTAGRPVVNLHPNGWRQGQITAGGSIAVSGNIVAERGVKVDVSGSTGMLDLSPTYLATSNYPANSLRGVQYGPVRIDSNGGSIRLAGGEMLYTDATLSGQAGGRSAVGGSLAVSSGRFRPQGQEFTSADENLIVEQSGYVLADGVRQGIGLAVTGADGVLQPALGRFAISSQAAGGFDALALGGNVRFSGPVDIRMPGRLQVAGGGVIYTTDDVRLTAPYVALGQAFRPPVLPGQEPFIFTKTDASGVTSSWSLAPERGTGRLIVTADLVDVGNLSLQGIGMARVTARGGDIRGNGTLSMAGDLVMEAGQIYPVTLRSFGIFAHDEAAGAGGAAGRRGSITLVGSGERDLPLSAGGTLSLYASRIEQGGSLRAPIGVINLGWNGSGQAPVDPVAGSTRPSPITTDLLLGSQSSTSVSAVDSRTGRALSIPYGISFDGISWIDPAGNDITVGGAPSKTVNLSAQSVVTAAGSLIDISGGGDLFAYRWIAGNGGSRDILGSLTSFAVLPGYGFEYAPFAPFNPVAPNLQGAAGYVTGSLQVGDQITLGDSPGLAAGSYTLLPARYALLPGAFLISPQSGAPVGSVALADGASLGSGYRANVLDAGRTGVTLMQRFEIAPASTFRQRATYEVYEATPFLGDAARARDFAVPRLPGDAGQLSLSATSSMVLNGRVGSGTLAGGLGALVDLSSPGDILINADGTGGGAGVLALSVSQLNRFGAESLLVGGQRVTTPTGTGVAVTTRNLTVQTAGEPLRGTDIILVSKGLLSVAAGSEIRGTGAGVPQELVLGDPAVVGSGDGTLLRVSGSAGGSIIRRGVGGGTDPQMMIGAGAVIGGGSIILDSTAGTRLDPLARLEATGVALNSGQITLVFDDAGEVAPTSGLVLAGRALESLQASARTLSLLSYSSVDIYGTGQLGSLRGLDALTLSAAALRSYNAGEGAASFAARSIRLENPTNRVAPAPSTGVASGVLRFEADEITLGAGRVAVSGQSRVDLSASSRLLAVGSGGFEVAGDLRLETPLLTAAQAAVHGVSAGGAVSLVRPVAAASAAEAGGLGARFSIEGAAVSLDSEIVLPSGELVARATAGDLRLGSNGASLINLAGVSKVFLDVSRFTDGGTATLESATGFVVLGVGGTVDVSAPAGGGNAGGINVRAQNGGFDLLGVMKGGAATGRRAGSFTLDAGRLAGGALSAIDSRLNDGSFTQAREYRLRAGDVLIDGAAKAALYRVTADRGTITVTGRLDASGVTGGVIDLAAGGSLVVAAGAEMSVAGASFNAAGQGGRISLAAGSSRDGVAGTDARLDLQTGSVIDLSVAEAGVGSESLGRFTGTLHLRAPRNADGTDLGVAPINGTIRNASSIVVEGYKVYDVTDGTGVISGAVQSGIRTDAQAFLGEAGTASVGYDAMRLRLLGDDGQRLDSRVVLVPGAEIVHRTGDLSLGAANSTPSGDWNLETFRFGPMSAPGVLTLRAAGNLTFFNTLSDGFAAVDPAPAGGNSALWLAPLMAANPLLPTNTQSWSYRLTAGADLASADFRSVRPLAALAAGSGMIQLGKNLGAANAPGGNNALTSSLISQGWQVIRTGSGDIDLSAGRSLRLLNTLASIYTAGTQVSTPTQIFAPNDFVMPVLTRPIHPNQGDLGAVQQTYAAQYSMAGGNISITAGSDIERLTRTTLGDYVPDSSRQMPVNWLYRRGYVDPSTGEFGVGGVGVGQSGVTDPAASTTWWVDFSNFFQGVGALGGGNITLVAGGSVANVDAVAPTNARAPRGVPDLTRLVELGGGDVLVRAGTDINAGIYYVERGSGRLEAGRDIVTNSTRSPSRNYLTSFINPEVLAPQTWLPTMLFAGKSEFNVSARGNILLGPTTNPFLLPAGLNNKFWYKTYFSTYDAASAVRVSSLGGEVTLRHEVVLPTENTARSILQVWMERANLLTTGANGAAFNQPWLRLAETSVEPFTSVFSLAPPTLDVTAFSGDINVVGDLTLAPAARGTLDLLASGSLNALQPAGRSNILVPGQSVTVWNSSRINLSDADPAAIPGVMTPFAYQLVAGRVNNQANTTRPGFLAGVANLFAETGSTGGVIQTKQALHTQGLLHLEDMEPARIYALGGNLSGLTVFTAKPARINASQDITDVAFYLQNLRDGDQSVVSAGRDIVASNANSPLRAEATAPGNQPGRDEAPLPGDLQISGPGSLVVLAGRNLDLGTGASNANGTGAGMVSIGNARNPYLPYTGSNLVAGAGLGPVTSLVDTTMDFDNFINEYVDGAEGQAYLAELGVGDFESLSEAEQNRVALEVFYRVLRDAGRDFSVSGNYDEGFAAIGTLFGGVTGPGEVLTRGRSVRTTAGGDISVFSPNGGLTLANSNIGNPLVPPGIITESGGNISIFTDGNVDIGIGRIFTLRGGDMIIWSSAGNIAAGTSSKTVASAPPTRVLIDPQSADVSTDLAGLATGGGIGVLATVEGIPPGNVDLIAPAGVIDAGDAGIRSAGNLNLAATQVLNASNIAVTGSSAGAPSAPSVSAPNVGGLTSAANTAGASSTAATAATNQATQRPVESQPPPEEPASLVTVEVIGYGGGEDAGASAEEEKSADEEEDEKEKQNSGEPTGGAAPDPAAN